MIHVSKTLCLPTKTSQSLRRSKFLNDNYSTVGYRVKAFGGMPTPSGEVLQGFPEEGMPELRCGKFVGKTNQEMNENI